MGLVRCIIFISTPTIQQYEALAHRVGQSRSALMRHVLDQGIPDAERFVRSFGPAPQPPAPQLVDAQADLPEAAAPLQRRRGRPSGSDRVRQLATLEQLVKSNLQESPELDIEAVRRLVMANAEAFLGLPPSPELLETALGRVFSQRADDVPRPVGGNRPPE